MIVVIWHSLNAWDYFWVPYNYFTERSEYLFLKIFTSDVHRFNSKTLLWKAGHITSTFKTNEDLTQIIQSLKIIDRKYYFPMPWRTNSGRGYSFKGFKTGIVIHCWIKRKKFCKWTGKTVTWIQYNRISDYR